MLIPDGWVGKALGEVAVKIQDGTHFSPKSTEGSCRYLTSKNVRFGYLDLTDCGWISQKEHNQIYKRCDVRKGDLLLTKDGANTGNATLNPLDEPFSLLSSVAMLRLDEKRASARYLLHYLLSPSGQNRLKFGMSGNAITRLTLEKIRAFQVPFPDVDVQNRIADILDAADAAIRQTEAVIAKLRQMKAGLLHDLLTRGLDEQGRLRDPQRHPEQFKDSPLGRIPQVWDTKAIDDIASHVGSGATPTGGSEVYKSEGVLFIRSQNVTFEGLLLDDVAFIDNRTHRAMSRSEVFPHDVLLNITGASIGRCCALPDGLGTANVNQHVCAIRLPEARRADAVYLSAVLSSHIGQSQIDRLNAGGNREGLNYENIRAFFVPWPQSGERSKISERLEAHDVRLRAEERYLAKLTLHKRGLMHDLFTGRVRV